MFLSREEIDANAIPLSKISSISRKNRQNNHAIALCAYSIQRCHAFLEVSHFDGKMHFH